MQALWNLRHCYVMKLCVLIIILQRKPDAGVQKERRRWTNLRETKKYKWFRLKCLFVCLFFKGDEGQRIGDWSRRGGGRMKWGLMRQKKKARAFKRTCTNRENIFVTSGQMNVCTKKKKLMFLTDILCYDQLWYTLHTFPNVSRGLSRDIDLSY